MKIRFLGTGAADWKGIDERGEYRRFTSTLFDDALLVDVTETVMDQIQPETIRDVFFTHSHRDHFQKSALEKLAPCRAYAHKSWAYLLQGEGIEVIALEVGETVNTPSGFSVTAMPSNHSTEQTGEATLHYLFEKDGKRVLYATDGAWLRNEEHHTIGAKQLDAAIFDATIGDGFEGDWRVFEHNSIDMVRLMVKTLLKMGRLHADAPVFLTHMARTLHADQATLEKNLEKPLIASKDGLEVEI